METVIDIFKAYNGTGYYCILFIVALIYLWFTEEDRTIRAVLVIAPTVIQVLFFVPYFYMLYNVLDEGTYYRILWLLPMTLTIAYAFCRVIGNNTRVGLVLVSLILIISGHFVYSNVNVTRAENLYKIPDEAIELCEMVKPEEGRERVWAAFPPDMIHYVRQYTTRIQMPYGRDSIVESWLKEDNAMADLYLSPGMDAAEAARLCREYYCNYMILEKDREITGSLEAQGMSLIGETTNYLVYRTDVPFWDDVTDETTEESTEE